LTADIPGPSGIIEAIYQPAATPAAAAAVLCHPHPQYGGNLHDAVLGCVAEVLQDAGVAVVRFNFRGVGRSEGCFDAGRGETDDLRAVAAWLSTTHPGPLWLCGYSFGAYVVCQALAAGLIARRAILVAPPNGPMPFPALPPNCPVDVIAGDADTFIDQAALAAWTGVDLHRIAGADHFFTGRFGDLTRALGEILGDSSGDTDA
jgi:uncharacterized protein